MAGNFRDSGIPESIAIDDELDPLDRDDATRVDASAEIAALIEATLDGVGDTSTRAPIPDLVARELVIETPDDAVEQDGLDAETFDSRPALELPPFPSLGEESTENSLGDLLGDNEPPPNTDETAYGPLGPTGDLPDAGPTSLLDVDAALADQSQPVLFQTVTFQKPTPARRASSLGTSWTAPSQDLPTKSANRWIPLAVLGLSLVMIAGSIFALQEIARGPAPEALESVESSVLETPAETPAIERRKLPVGLLEDPSAPEPTDSPSPAESEQVPEPAVDDPAAPALDAKPDPAAVAVPESPAAPPADGSTAETSPAGTSAPTIATEAITAVQSPSQDAAKRTGEAPTPLADTERSRKNISRRPKRRSRRRRRPPRVKQKQEVLLRASDL